MLKKNIFLFGVALFYLMSCEKNESETNAPRGHGVVIEKVYHGIGHLKPERYCKDCHGYNLQGGDNLIPSCYSCHGQNWKSSEQETTFAPSSHTDPKNGYFHHPSLLTPHQDCTSCHGESLDGSEASFTPSCYLCHTQKWP